MSSTIFYRFQHISIPCCYHFFTVSSSFLYRFCRRFVTVSITVSCPFPASNKNGKEMLTAFLRNGKEMLTSIQANLIWARFMQRWVPMAYPQYCGPGHFDLHREATTPSASLHKWHRPINYWITVIWRKKLGYIGLGPI
jgi:hypothetical protein